MPRLAPRFARKEARELLSSAANIGRRIRQAGRAVMTHSGHPLARRTVIKGIGAGVAAGAIGAMPAQAATAVATEGGEIWSSEYWTKKGDIPLVDVPQADRRAEGRRAGAPGGVLCPRLVGDLAGVRPQRPRQGRIFRDERVRPLRVRLLDHGSRELRQVRPHLGQCRYRQRRRGSEGRGRTHHPRDRAEEIPFRRRVLRRAARRRLCHGGARSHRPPGVRRLHLQGRGLADA